MDTKEHRHMYFTRSDLVNGNARTKDERKDFLCNNFGWNPNMEFKERGDVAGLHVTQKYYEEIV